MDNFGAHLNCATSFASIFTLEDVFFISVNVYRTLFIRGRYCDVLAQHHNVMVAAMKVC